MAWFSNAYQRLSGDVNWGPSCRAWEPRNAASSEANSSSSAVSGADQQNSSSERETGGEEGLRPGSRARFPLFGNVTPDVRDPHTNPNAKALAIQRGLHRAEAWAGRGRTEAFQQATADYVRQLDPGRARGPDFAPCVVCHANPRDAGASVLEPAVGFSSSLTLQYNDLETYAWSFGHRYVVREQQDWALHPLRLPPSVHAARLLRAETTVPVPEVVAAWKEDQVAITITERARGRSLRDVWDDLSEPQKEAMAKAVGGYVKQWRKLKSDHMQALDGGEIVKCDHVIGGQDGVPFLFATEAEYLQRLREQLLDEGYDEAYTDGVLRVMPRSTPFTFTHGYLSLDHIMVEDEHVVAIVGFSGAAFLPVWAEYLGLCFSHDKAERQWKELLQRQISYYGASRQFWSVYTDLLETKHSRSEAHAQLKMKATGRRFEADWRDLAEAKKTEAAADRAHEARRSEAARKEKETARLALARARLAEREAQRAEEQRDAMARQWLAERREQKDQARREARAAASRETETPERPPAGAHARRSRHPQSSLSGRARPAPEPAAGDDAQQQQQPPGGGGGGSAGHRRAVSVGPKYAFGGRPYKPQPVGLKVRRPSELTSPRLRRLSLELGLEDGTV